MDKLKMHSPDLTQDHIARLRELFPGCVTEAKGEDGAVRLAVDFDLLRQELSGTLVEGPQERYQLNWPGKREALLTANAPIAKTLRPCRDQSVDFDTTKNLFIEGDNLDALKLLQEAYLGKVTLIYIDPPYNTGNDFVYSDKFSESSQSFLLRSNQVDAAGSRLVANTASNGRFHSDWLSMLYPRLRLARTLLSDEGVIFVSIDDNEIANLRRLMDEVFGEDNFVENYIWESNFRPDNSSRVERENAQYVLCFARNKTCMPALVGAQKATEGLPSLTKSSMKPSTLTFDPSWVEFSLPDGTYPAGERNSGYTLEDSVQIVGGRATKPFSLTGRVIWSQPYLEAQVAAGAVIVIKGDGFVPYSQKVATSVLAPTTLIPRDQVGDVLAGNAELRSIFGAPVFNHPKPTSLLKYLIGSATSQNKSAVVMDFFAGSSSTAHAVLSLNSDDGGRRRFIQVQLPEPTPEDSEARKAGYQTISDLSKERIRRAGKSFASGLMDEDLGFRVLKVDTSNMADVFYAPDAVNQGALEGFTDNIKPDRSPEDLLFQVMLDWGVDLALPITRQTIQGREVLFVDGNALAACFDASGRIDEAFVKELATHKPLRAVFRDAGFVDSAAKINVEQIFKLLSPATEVKCI
jgi:adenine-specific DNA-methyltransferase